MNEIKTANDMIENDKTLTVDDIQELKELILFLEQEVKK